MSSSRLFYLDSLCCPLSTGNGQETTGRDVDHVVPDKTLGVFGIRVLDQWSNTAPGRQDVSSSDLDIGREVVLDLVEDPLDLLFLRDGVLRDGGCGIGGTGNNVALPWEEEDDSTVGSGGVEQTHVLGTVVVLLISM